MEGSGALSEASAFRSGHNPRFLGSSPTSASLLSEESASTSPSASSIPASCSPSFFSFFLRFYLLIHEKHTQRETETQAKGEAGSMQGARCGTPSQVSRSHPGPKAGAKPLSHPGIPYSETLLKFNKIY